MVLWVIGLVLMKKIKEEFQTHHILYVIIGGVILFAMLNMIDALKIDPATGITINDFIGGDNILTDIEVSMTLAFEEFTKNEIFRQAGVAITFIYSMTPSIIPVPNEVLMTPIVLAEPTPDEQFNQVIFLIILTSIGGFIGDSLMFMGAKRHIHKLIKSSKQDELEQNHWFHRFGMPLFLFTPSLWFAGGGAEISLIVAGYAQVDFKKLAPFLLGGNLIRGIWGGAIFLSVLGLL